MEASVCNLVEPGETVLVGVNGLWGDRLADMCDRHCKFTLNLGQSQMSFRRGPTQTGL